MLNESELRRADYNIFYIFTDGRKVCISWPKFTSAMDACKSLAMLATWGIPKDVVRAVAEDANGNWLCEIRRRPMG